MSAIRNPIEWGMDQYRFWSHAFASGRDAVYRPDEDPDALVPSIRHIGTADLRDVLRKGFSDFAAYRTDVMFVVLVYPLAGVVLARAMYGSDMLQLLFPLAAGFALIGPFAAIGLYEMSRRREEGVTVTWRDAFGVLESPSFGAILALGLILLAIFLIWILTAQVIYDGTLGPDSPASMEALLHAVFTTARGWAMLILGVGVGMVFALLVLAIGVVSFPLLIDRRVTVATAVRTSVQAFAVNTGPMLMWGLIVTAGLVIGSIPLFVGLVIVLPVLGHATWHLYRRVVPR